MKKVAFLVALCMVAQAAVAQMPFEQPDALLTQDAPNLNEQGLVQVGEELAWSEASPRFTTFNKLEKAELIWEETISFPNSTYIAVHFDHFDLPRGARLVVQHPNKEVRTWTYRGFGKADSYMEDGFWAVHIPGDTAVVKLFSRVSVDAGAVKVDKIAWGYDEWDRLGEQIFNKALCGQDDSVWAQCESGTVYNTSKAVARLLIGGSSACTGWLVGSEGHLMTNEHCISTNSAAGNTDYEFMAEGSCNTNCASWGACPGTVAATSGTLVQDDAALDYALILLPGNPSTTYGYLQMRNGAAQTGEGIYIPQHPAAWGKKIATCTVSGFTNGCSSNSYQDVGYFCDTQGGSSGSPVIATSDNAVVALHHCANCPNRGVPIDRVIADLNNVPADGIAGGGGPPPPPPPPPSCSPAGDSCSSNSDCCSNKCRGKRGAKTCR